MVFRAEGVGAGKWIASSPGIVIVKSAPLLTVVLCTVCKLCLCRYQPHVAQRGTVTSETNNDIRDNAIDVKCCL